MDSNTSSWKNALDIIKISVSNPIFTTWFSQTHIAGIIDREDRVLVKIGCTSPFVKTTIETRYYGLIQDTLVKILGKPCSLEFLVKDDPGVKKEDKLVTPLFDNKGVSEYEDAARKARVSRAFTFENFAVSSSNQMAWAAAEAVSKTPGEAYNPLFIWGGVGVGKTHLMLAVGNEVLKSTPHAKVLFCTAEDFTNDIVEGIRNKTTPEVRNKYRKLKLLMIDDIQFIAGKDTAQEEFFHTFNTVTNAGGQVILTSDRPPSEISKLEERLRSRFEAGLIVDISPPDFELRCAILQIKSGEKGLNLDSSTIQLIASNLESARKIQGFLIRLSSEARLRNISIDEAMVKSILGKGEDAGATLVRATPDEVITGVADFYSLGKRQLLGISRARPIARPRQVLMYLLRTHLGLPLEEVGRLVGRDHTTVMHAVDLITNLATTDVKIREELLGIKQKI